MVPPLENTAADLSWMLYESGRQAVPIDDMQITGPDALAHTENSQEVDSLHPPEGHTCWLDYAAETMDVRSVQIQRVFADEPDVSAAAMRQATP